LFVVSFLLVFAVKSRNAAVAAQIVAENAARREQNAREEAQRAAEAEKSARREAERQRDLAIAQRLTAESEVVNAERRLDLEPAALLAAESLRRHSSLESDRAVREFAAGLPHLLARLPVLGIVGALAFSRDGRWLAAAGSGAGMVIDTATWKTL